MLPRLWPQLLRRPRASLQPRAPSRLLSTAPPQVIGSAPQYTRHLILEASAPIPSRSVDWPARLEALSPAYTKMTERWRRLPGLEGLGSSFCEARSPSATSALDPPETFSGWIYPDHIPIPTLSIATLPAFEKFLANLPSPPSALPAPSAMSTTRTPQSVHIYVCTHGSRDCRCGDIGEPLYQALVKEASRRGIDAEQLHVARIAHIGGHVYAGNALVYREGVAHDWYGLLRAEDAASLLDHAMSSSTEPLYPFWRGRLNVPAVEVKAHYSLAMTPASDPSSTAHATSKQRKETPRKPLGDKVVLFFEDYEGDETEVIGYEGESVMEAARRADLEAILATCGGHCECATCHCHIEPYVHELEATLDTSVRQPVPVPSLPSLPPISEEEEDQLEFALGRDEDSRLACQIPVTKELGAWIAQGGRIRLPEY